MIKEMSAATSTNNIWTQFVEPHALQHLLREESNSSPIQIDTREKLESVLSSKQETLIKTVIRNHNWPVDHPIRKHLWDCLCHYQGNQNRTEGLYHSLLQECIGTLDCPQSLPSFVDPAYCLTYQLSGSGKKALSRVLCVLSQAFPHITYCPLLYPLCALFLHFYSEEQTYFCLADLLSANGSSRDFLATRKLDHNVQIFVVMRLAKKFVKPIYLNFPPEKKGNLDVPHKLYFLWLWWIFKGLHFEYLVRVMDCYLLDGIKALYRVALAMMMHFNRALESSTKAKEDTRDISEKMVFLSTEHPFSIEKLLKEAYGIKNLTTAYILRKKEKATDLLRDLPDLKSLLDYGLAEPGLDIAIASEARGLPPIGVLQTEIIGPKEIELFWSWIPLRLTTYQPHLVYSSNEDGSSLTAFFRKVDPWEPTILLVRALNNEVFGAYCSDSWRKRKDPKDSTGIYFGTGESFLFRLHPDPEVYYWVAHRAEEGTPSTDYSSLIMTAQEASCIMVGGGEEGPGLMLDESLTNGQTHACATFRSKPLCSQTYFHCKLVEVIGFRDKKETDSEDTPTGISGMLSTLDSSS